jgi:tyrosine-protein kinase Etk/Wzc
MQQRPNQAPAPISLREIDIGFYITHYWNLIWRWKWYILISAPIVMVGWFTYVIKFGSVKPELDAMVVIGMDDPRTMSAVQNVGESVQSRIDIVRGRSFLKEIVEQLSLQLSLNDLQRSAVFDSIKVDSSAGIGGYNLKIEKDQKTYQILYTNKQLGIKEKVIDQGDIYKFDSLKLPGIYLHFSPSFLSSPVTTSFNISPMRVAIERLRKSIVIQGGGGGGNGGTAVALSVKGRDYRLIAQTANLIAANFIEKTSNFKKIKTREVIEVLKKQLETATEQLDIAQNAVQHFRQQNPNVGLGTDLTSSVTNLTQIETNVFNSQQIVKEAEQIKTKLIGSSDNPDDINMYMNEAISFLLSRNSLAASAVQTEFNQLLRRQQELRTGFDKNHPFVIENRNRIATIKTRITNLLDEYVGNVKLEVSRQQNQVSGITQRMQGLPSQQLRLAELERQAQVSEQIHSTVMARYNQAKIADATEVSDVFIMDNAIEPVPPPDFVNVLILMGIGVLIGIGVAFAPPVIFDFFDKTVRSETALTKILPFTVLECLPVIDKKEKHDHHQSKNAPIHRTIDKKLVTSEFSPDFTNEIFRSLRAKIMLRFHDQQKKNILITSYDMSEGKSLISANIAITMAQQKLRTALIDGDIRRGVQHNAFVLNKAPGLSSFLFTDEPVNNTTVTPLLQQTHVENLTLISSGQNVPNPSELLGSLRFKELLGYLSTIFDVIILDTPPIGLAPDAALVSDMFNGCLVVIKAGSTNTIELKKKLTEYPNIRDKIFGVVLNQAIVDKRMRKYKYSSYYYNADVFREGSNPPQPTL